MKKIALLLFVGVISFAAFLGTTTSVQAQSCYFNYKGVKQSGGQVVPDNSVIFTGSMVGQQCQTSGTPILLNSWYATRPSGTNDPAWPCTGEAQVGTACSATSGGITFTGQKICTAGPAEKVMGCFSLTSQLYAEISRTPVGSATATPTPSTTLTPIPTRPVEDPPLDPLYPSTCGCQAYFSIRSATCTDQEMNACSAPNSRNGGITYFNERDASGACWGYVYYCNSGGIPPAGDCGCLASESTDLTSYYPTEEICLGRESTSVCQLPNSYNPGDSGVKYIWSNNRCFKETYNCTGSAITPNSWKDYFWSLIRGQNPTVPSGADVNRDGKINLADFEVLRRSQ